MPHIGLPHSEPVTSVMNVNAAPTGALAIASVSDSLIRHTSAMKPLTAMNAYSEQAHPRARHVHVDDAERFALLVVGRRHDQAAVQGRPRR